MNNDLESISQGLKIFERTMYTQIINFMENKLSVLLTGFPKIHGTQNWENTLDIDGFVAAWTSQWPLTH